MYTESKFEGWQEESWHCQDWRLENEENQLTSG